MNEISGMEFPTSPDRFVRVVTALVIVLLATVDGAVIGTLYITHESTEDMLFTGLSMIILTTTIIGATWLYTPLKYVVSYDTLRVVRPLKPLDIPLKDITDAKAVDIDLKRAMRTWGNGGLFAITGAYRIKPLGNVWMYTRNRNFVLIEADKRYVLGPDDIEMFLMTLRSRIGRKR